jgi:hypothetical protein
MALHLDFARDKTGNLADTIQSRNVDGVYELIPCTQIADST